FSFDGVHWKRKIGRRKNRRLGVLDIHVIYLRQITNRTSDGYITFIFNRTGLGTVSNADIAVFGIGQKRNKQHLHPLVGKYPSQFWKLNIITNQDTDFATVRIKNTDLIAALHPIVFRFIRRNMYLSVLFSLAVPLAK